MNKNYTVHDCTLVDIPTFIDTRGSITVLEKDLPFEVKRIFWLHNILEGEERGVHALLEGMEIIVAVHGSFKVDLDDGISVCTFVLDNPSMGLIIKPGIWFKTYSYKDNGVSLILSDEEYSRDKYIYDYNEYKRLRK